MYLIKIKNKNFKVKQKGILTKNMKKEKYESNKKENSKEVEFKCKIVQILSKY